MTVAGRLMVEMPVLRNTDDSIELSCDPPPKMTDVKDAQDSNAEDNTWVTAFEIVTESRPLP